MAHCRSPTKCLKNDHFPSNQIQIVPDSNYCKLFMDNRLPARTNFSPDTSDNGKSKPKSKTPFYLVHPQETEALRVSPLQLTLHCVETCPTRINSPGTGRNSVSARQSDGRSEE